MTCADPPENCIEKRSSMDGVKWKIVIMLTPDLRAVQNEMMRAISKRPVTELKPGAPRRNPNIREVCRG